MIPIRNKIINTLDNFVEIKSLVQEDMVVIPPPQQRKINLKDPILRNKGIRKKKNIENKILKLNEKDFVRLRRHVGFARHCCHCSRKGRWSPGTQRK